MPRVHYAIVEGLNFVHFLKQLEEARYFSLIVTPYIVQPVCIHKHIPKNIMENPNN